MYLKYIVAIMALLSIVVIEVVALCHGINGHTLAASIGGATLIGGYALGRIKSLAKGAENAIITGKIEGDENKFNTG